MPSIQRILRPTTIVLVLLLATSACSQETIPIVPVDRPCVTKTAGAENGLRLLFIGNSLTYWNDMPGILAGLLEEAGVFLGRLEVVASPNYGLQDHWVSVGARATLRESGGWDYVVMQQGPSATEGRPSLLDYSQRFATEIREAGAEPAMYMVWPAQSRPLDFAGVSDSYATAAENIGGLLMPVGEAWLDAWATDSSLDLYGPDGFHPSEIGSYLAALVMFEQLSGQDPDVLGDTFCVPSTGPVELDPFTAQLLKDAARQANEDFARSP